MSEVCPHCRCRTFAHVDEPTLDGGWDNSAMIRCVECKRCFANPTLQSQARRVEELEGALRLAAERVRAWEGEAYDRGDDPLPGLISALLSEGEKG